MRNIFVWLKDNAFGIVLSVLGGLLVYGQVTTAAQVSEQMEESVGIEV